MRDEDGVEGVERCEFYVLGLDKVGRGVRSKATARSEATSYEYNDTKARHNTRSTLLSGERVTVSEATS